MLITELERPLLVRRAVSFGSAVVEGRVEVEGVVARRVASIGEARAVQGAGEIPVIVDPHGEWLAEYRPAVLVDARMLKRDPGPQPADARLTIGLGPGFEAPRNADAVIETNRGHFLGRVIWQGEPQPDTGRPGTVLGHTADRVLRAPANGVVAGRAAIGASVRAGEVVAEVGGEAVRAPFDGVLRGLVHDGLSVATGTKIGDLDPRGVRVHCFTLSEKSLAIGGGVLEAVLSAPPVRQLIRTA